MLVLSSSLAAELGGYTPRSSGGELASYAARSDIENIQLDTEGVR